MAISVDYSPTGPQPVYQPFFFQVQSSNYTQPQFRFVFDVYRNGSFVQRVRQLPKPGTNVAIFSPARILESYLSYDLYSYSNDCSQDNCITQYQVRFGEEYGPTTAAPVVYANLANSSGYTWNGTVQYQNYYNAASGGFNEFYLKNHTSFPSAGRFLTNSPSAQTISTTDYGTLSCFNFDVPDNGVDANVKKATILEVTTYQNSGGSISTYFYYSANSGTSIDYKLLHFPAGPYNINTIPYGAFLSGKFPAITIDTDYAYEIKLWSHSGALPDSVISETRYFEFEDCSKYENVRLMFLNRLGAWDCFNFRLVSRDFVTTDRSLYKKNLPIDYYYGLVVGSRESTVLNSVVKKTKKVTTNWVDDETSTWLEELWTSPEVYEIAEDAYGNKIYYPVVITTTNQEIKKRINDQLYNYELEYVYASDVNVQRN